MGVSSRIRWPWRVRRPGREVRAARAPVPPGFCSGHPGGGGPSRARPFRPRPHRATPRIRRRRTRGGVAGARHGRSGDTDLRPRGSPRDRQFLGGVPPAGDRCCAAIGFAAGRPHSGGSSAEIRRLRTRRHLVPAEAYSSADRAERRGYGRTLAMACGQSAAADSAQTMADAHGQPITESNMVLRAAAQVAAVMDGDLGRRADRPPATERGFSVAWSGCVAGMRGEVQLPGGCSAWSRPVWQRSAGPLRRLCAVPGVDWYSGAGAGAGLNTHRCRQ